MVERIDFGDKSGADRLRSKYGSYLADRDDARRKTVVLSPDAPDRVIEEAETEAFLTQGSELGGAGMTELTAAERRSLERQHRTFNWQSYGFEAMRAKAALQERGATEWQDFYEPGEGAAGALENLRESKQRSAGSGASIGVGGDYTDEEELAGLGRQQAQVGRMRAGQLDGAIDAGFEGDDDAQEYVREQGPLSETLDISLSLRHPDGTPGFRGSGEHFDRLLDIHESRDRRVQAMDEGRLDTVTTDPFLWAETPQAYDYPGVDTPEPREVHAGRSERSQLVDESLLAETTNHLGEWLANPNSYDLPGIDTPMGKGPDPADFELDFTRDAYDDGFFRY